jgi:hypothetical protein
MASGKPSRAPERAIFTTFSESAESITRKFSGTGKSPLTLTASRV